MNEKQKKMASKPKTITKHVVAVLNWPTCNGDRLVRAEDILAKMTGNPNFTTPLPEISTVQANINTLRLSQAAAAARGNGLAAQRDVDMEVVKKDLMAWLLYVQNIANGTPDKAVQLIESVSFAVKKHSPRVKPDLAVKNGNIPGEVLLVGRGAGSRVAHEWQMSKDQVNWTDLPATILAKTSVVGQTYGTTIYFRHRTTTAAGTSVWTSPVGVLVK